MRQLNNSILKQTQMNSALSLASTLNPSANAGQKNILFGLSLTSLIDCFTILVVYLLMTTTIGGKELETPRGLNLPQATHSSALEGDVVLTVIGDKYLLNNKPVSLSDLDDKLKSLQAGQEGLIIQADKKTDFSKLNPIINMTLQTGYKKIKFAVIHGDAS